MYTIKTFYQTRRIVPTSIEADAPFNRNLQLYSADLPVPPIVAAYFGHGLFERHTIGIIDEMIGGRRAQIDLFSYSYAVLHREEHSDSDSDETQVQLIGFYAFSTSHRHHRRCPLRSTTVQYCAVASGAHE